MNGFILKNNLRETDPRHHEDLMDSMAYMVATMEAKMRDEYCCMYINPRPWWIPNSIFKWILGKVLAMANFRY